MKLNIPKKILMTAIYCLIGHIINSLLDTLFGYNGNGYTIWSVLIVGAVICASSRHIRVGKLKSEHKGDGSTEKAVFNSNVKSKIRFIIGTPDFKAEMVIFVILSFVLILIPYLGTSFAYGFDAVFSNSTNIIYLIAWMILMPLYMAALDVFAWLSAYNRCYKRREF